LHFGEIDIAFFILATKIFTDFANFAQKTGYKKGAAADLSPGDTLFPF
jgi:hypothetical protein